MHKIGLELCIDEALVTNVLHKICIVNYDWCSKLISCFHSTLKYNFEKFIHFSGYICVLRLGIFSLLVRKLEKLDY